MKDFEGIQPQSLPGKITTYHTQILPAFQLLGTEKFTAVEGLASHLE